MMPQGIITLSALAHEVGSVLRGYFSSRRYWVTAEITGLKISAGHCYLQLADKEEGGFVKSEFSAICWKDNFQRIHERFTNETGEVLRSQLAVLCFVEVSYHERFGLSLLIHDIDPAFTLGKLEQERRKTIQRLKDEGIYDRNRNLKAKQVMQRIALISAADSRGYEDFIKTLEENPEGYKFHIKLYPALLQGEKAAKDITSALIKIFHDIEEYKFDAVIIVRGGGAATSLACFDDYNLSRAVARFPVPVITGIGHTANRTVTDEVAHDDKITPTAAAVYLIGKMEAFEMEISLLMEGISSASYSWIESENENLENSGNLMQEMVMEMISTQQQDLQKSGFRLHHSVASFLMEGKLELHHVFSSVKRFSLQYSDMHHRYMDDILSGIRMHSLNVISKESALMDSKENHVRILDPMQVLNRGFTYTLHKGKLVKEPGILKPEDEIETVFANGRIKSKITDDRTV